MFWMVLLLIWIAAPVAELGIILVLFAMNEKKKKRILELERHLRGADPSGETVNQSWSAPAPEPTQILAPAPISASTPIPASTPTPKSVSAPTKPPKLVSAPIQTPAKQKPQRRADTGYFRGTVSLIVGMVLVVTAGLIFATTTWHILPDICKAGFVMAFAVLFFGASVLAERYLKISKTSCAFYILGSIFLMVSVLAVGYFRILGAEFVLTGWHRWRVLSVGSVITTAALLAGCRRFGDRIYTRCSLWGIPVSVFFCMCALRLDYDEKACLMVCYATVLIGIFRMMKGKTDQESVEGQQPAPPSAGIKENLESFAWLQFSAAGVFFLPLLMCDFIEIVSWMEKTVSGMVLPGLLLRILAAGCLIYGTGLLKREKSGRMFPVLHQLCILIFCHYTGFYMPGAFACKLAAGMAVSSIWFLVSQRSGTVMYMAILTIDTAILLADAVLDSGFHSPALIHTEIQMAATMSLILLTAVYAWRGQRFRMMRSWIPVLLLGLTVTIPAILRKYTAISWGYPEFFEIYLIGMMAWDLGKKDRFWKTLFAMGMLCSAGYMWRNGTQLMLLLTFAGYLFLKVNQMSGTERIWLIRTGGAYLLAGISFLSPEGVIWKRLIPSIIPLSILAVGYAVSLKHAEDTRFLPKEDPFWDIAGLILFAEAMRQFCLYETHVLWKLIPLTAVFAGLYAKYYLEKSRWKHALLTLLFLPVPLILADCYCVPETVLYPGVMASVLLTGIFARSRRAIVDPEKCVDWYHVLIVLVLFPMMIRASSCWRFAYLLLLALYALSFAAVSELRKAAFTAVQLLLLLAYWTQPFLRIPEQFFLEIQLIPVFLITRLLPAVWGMRKGTVRVQKGLDLFCLLTLMTGAMIRGDIFNALILEMLCLTVFVLSHVKKSVWWIRTSGIIMVIVVLYMTKGFWLSISWWVYLLCAGLGLIGFAAWNETRKRGKE